MSREIKFRVWDGVDYMTMPFTLSDLQRGHPGFTTDCVVMQFTGLKDARGSDIYEGDIVHSNTYGKSGVYRFDEGSFYIHGIDADGGRHLIIHDAVIIGNICENPKMF